MSTSPDLDSPRRYLLSGPMKVSVERFNKDRKCHAGWSYPALLLDCLCRLDGLHPQTISRNKPLGCFRLTNMHSTLLLSQPLPSGHSREPHTQPELYCSISFAQHDPHLPDWQGTKTLREPNSHPVSNLRAGQAGPSKQLVPGTNAPRSQHDLWAIRPDYLGRL